MPTFFNVTAARFWELRGFLGELRGNARGKVGLGFSSKKVPRREGPNRSQAGLVARSGVRAALKPQRMPRRRGRGSRGPSVEAASWRAYEQFSFPAAPRGGDEGLERETPGRAGNTKRRAGNKKLRAGNSERAEAGGSRGSPDSNLGG